MEMVKMIFTLAFGLIILAMLGVYVQINVDFDTPEEANAVWDRIQADPSMVPLDRETAAAPNDPAGAQQPPRPSKLGEIHFCCAPWSLVRAAPQSRRPAQVSPSQFKRTRARTASPAVQVLRHTPIATRTQKILGRSAVQVRGLGYPKPYTFSAP
jgi:hypothetical protein